MLITFEKCHTYNKVFFLDLDKSAFYPPLIVSLPVELFSLLHVLGGCRIQRFTKMLIIRSLIDFPSGGFGSFAKNKVMFLK